MGQFEFLKQSKERFQKIKFNNISLFVAIANTMDKKLTLQNVTKDTNPNSLPIRSILDFDGFAKEKSSDLIYKSKYYGDYDHGSVSLVAVYDALPFIFNFYALDFPFREFFDPSYKDDRLLINHYNKVSERMGYKVSPPGEFVDALAHQLMDSNQPDRAYKFLQLNVSNYPGSYKPYESMGDYYLAKKDKVQAEEFYLKALAIKENAGIRTKIEKLRGK